ncbi:MAG: hypothetical protein ABFC77_02180 [Thermoguttaceae bacterium]
MPTISTANVKQWLEQSEIDYFTHFVKAWIPFNAWYRHNYDKIETERDILEEVKTDGNRIRSRFVAKLEGEDADSEEIRNHIAGLHRRLSADPLKDRNDRVISLEYVSVGRNPNSKETLDFYGWKYTVERKRRPDKQVVCEVINKSGIVVTTIVQPGEWDIDGLQLHADYIALDAKKQSPLKMCYQKAHPYRFRSLLAESSEENPLLMDGYRFAREPAAIFAGLVDVLYAMRNLLFHGELVPDHEANRTYEPAYHLLRHMIATIV